MPSSLRDDRTPREPQFASVSTVATVLDVGRSKAYELVASGAIRSVRIGRSLKVDLADLDRFVADLRQAGAA